MEGGKVVLKTDELGEIAIPISVIQSFSTAKRVVASMKNGQVLRGELALGKSGEWKLARNHQVKVLAAKDVEAIYPQAVQEPGSLKGNLYPWLKWKGTGSLGYSLAQSAQPSRTLTASVNATHGQPDLKGLLEHWRSNYALSMVLARTEPTSGKAINANTVVAEFRQDYFYTPNNFIFGLAHFEHIQPQKVDFRQTYGLGIGRDLIRRPRVTASLLGGTTLVTQTVPAGVSGQSSEGLLGEKVAWNLSEQVKFVHQFNFYPNLSFGGRYRLDSLATLSFRISSHLSLIVNSSYRYLSVPLPGGRNNDLLMSTGLGVRF
jgi:hypothetical protein